MGKDAAVEKSKLYHSISLLRKALANGRSPNPDPPRGLDIDFIAVCWRSLS
jgi:hypothetical protein